MTEYFKKGVTNADDAVVVEAVQFDPTHQIDTRVKPWPDEQGIQPRDMSWGYLNTVQGRKHIHVGDWIVTDEAGNIFVYRDADFQAQFEPCSTVNTSFSQQALDEIKVATISEERVRQIVQEEIEQFQKRQFSWLRINGPQLPPHEVK